MLIKETDARTRLCPQSVETNPSPSLASGSGCIGSGCMAWREVSTQHGTMGYCGMAGMPAKVAAPLLGQTIETALAGGHAGGSPRILVPQ